MSYKAGEAHPNAKLTEKDVREIRELHEKTNIKQKEIAERFCMSQAQISKIINGFMWTSKSKKVMTNGDWIRSISDEELADWLLNLTGYCPPPCVCSAECIQIDCKECWTEWIEQEA